MKPFIMQIEVVLLLKLRWANVAFEVEVVFLILPLVDKFFVFVFIANLTKRFAAASIWAHKWFLTSMSHQVNMKWMSTIEQLSAGFVVVVANVYPFSSPILMLIVILLLDGFKMKDFVVLAFWFRTLVFYCFCVKTITIGLTDILAVWNINHFFNFGQQLMVYHLSDRLECFQFVPCIC